MPMSPQQPGLHPPSPERPPASTGRKYLSRRTTNHPRAVAKQPQVTAGQIAPLAPPCAATLLRIHSLPLRAHGRRSRVGPSPCKLVNSSTCKLPSVTARTENPPQPPAIYLNTNPPNRADFVVWWRGK